MIQSTSRRSATLREILAPVHRFILDSVYMRRQPSPDECDFVFGNPHELPLPGFVAALQRRTTPENKDWFAYKNNEPASQAAVAAALRERRGVPFEPADIFITNGAFAGISVVLTTILDPGDEAIFISPPWFFYEGLIAAVGGVPVRVRADARTFDLDLEAIEAAITPRTRAIIVNSPNNPTGRIYPAATLQDLAGRLEAASRRNGRTIYLISDEAYSRIIFDGRDYPSPTTFYPNSLLIYTFGKTLLTPGQRIGYIALPPTMPDRETLREDLLLGQIVTGFAFANALLQHALPELERLSIDVEALQHRRDRLVSVLRDMGYEVEVPEGTFYLMVRSPLADDMAFVNQLAAQRIYCLPGTVVEMPGYFRISLTANDEMVERSLPGFEAALRAARK